jgi:aerobic carbon-monoxide dehydrogenase large subunit
MVVKFGVGQSVKRVEDLRLLTGAGQYTDDINLQRQAYVYFLRSPHAHADIGNLDTGAAKRAPGVLGVFTGADLRAAGLGDLTCAVPLKQRDGTLFMPPRPALAVGRVRFVGDPVAMVVAETPAQARDAAEQIVVDYKPLGAVADIEAAVKPGAPLVWDQAKNNEVFYWTMGDDAKTKAAFAKAHKVVAIDIVNNRLAPSSMETRNAIGSYSADGRLTLHVACQGGAGLREELAHDIFKIPATKIRVVTPDVGGGFGMKIFMYPEYVNVLFAARAVGRPVKWSGERSEAFMADIHGRDHRTHAEVALDKDGKFLATRFSTQANLGAYLSHYGPFIPTMAGSGMLAGVYATPAVYVEVKGVYTNTAPIDAYRGAGRPEANYVGERLVDAAAREMRISPAELRRRNFIPPAAMPYTTALGLVYDSGEFARNMDDAVKSADWPGFAARKAESAKRGKLRGIGMATYIEACGGGPEETAQIRFDAVGGVTVMIGNQSNGQGHETAYAQIVADRLGVPFENVRVVQGDTDLIVYAGFTGGSRALPVGGSAVVGASERIIAKGKKLAAHLLETAEADIELKDGNFTVAGTDKQKTIAEVATAAFDTAKRPADMSPGLDEVATFAPPAATYPNGCHIAEVEIDQGTGTVSIVRYTIVDDFGRTINPLLLAGQVHGGSVQGIGQALYEGVVYDPSGQLITGSFTDYCLPRADVSPSFSFAYNEIPCKSNLLGIKGAGEAGAIGAPPAIINAVVDALSGLGVKHIDMPATPEKIWRLINTAPARAAE